MGGGEKGLKAGSARKMNCRAWESEWNVAMTPWGVGRRGFEKVDISSSKKNHGQGAGLGPKNVHKVRKMLPVLLELMAECRKQKLNK